MDVRCSRSRLTSVILPNPANGSNPELVNGQSPANSGTLVTRYDYDELGNKTAQTDAEGRTTRWAYDKQGRQLSRTLPMGQIESFVYDANGQRVQHTTFNSEIIGAQYDNLGRPSQLSFPNNKLRSFQYTLSGQIAEINDGGLVYRFTYDSRDRLLSATDPFGRTLNYGYDAIGNRTELSSARQQVQYQYDVLNRLREVVATLGTNPPQTSSYSYDAVGNRAGMVHPNGTVVEYQYDVRNRLKTLIHKASQTAGAAILLSLSYSVDASGLRTQISETRPGTGTTAITRVTSYTYDAVKRLTRETVSGTGGQARNTGWTYDKVGNRKTESSSGTLPRSQTYTYDANDRLLSETGTQAFTYTYDAAGNILQKQQGTAVVADYTWDAEGRMTQAVTGSGPSQKTIAYTYDANGIRRSQQISDASGTSRTEFLVDPNQAYAQVLEEWDANGNPLGDATLSNVYVYGDDLISQTLLAGDQISATSIYHYDGLGTTRALSAYKLDANGAPIAGHGAITDRYAYTAFGETDPAGSSGNTSGSTDNNYRYTGEQLDPNLGFYYLRARYMDARVGRFLGMDAWAGAQGNPLSFHKYAYANLNPALGVDPSGNFTSLYEAIVTAGAIGIGTAIASVGVAAYTGHNIGNDSDGTPDAAIVSFGASGGSGGLGIDLGADVIYHRSTNRWWMYPSFAPGLSPLTVFGNFRNRMGASLSAGLIYNMRSPEDWAGLGVGATVPWKAAHLLSRFASRSKMGYAIRQLARLAGRTDSSHWTLQFAASTSGPGAVRFGYRSNSFTANLGWGFGPIDVSSRINDILDGSIKTDIVGMLDDFGRAISILDQSL